jgi:hypothetical protein
MASLWELSSYFANETLNNDSNEDPDDNIGPSVTGHLVKSLYKQNFETFKTNKVISNKLIHNAGYGDY